VDRKGNMDTGYVRRTFFSSTMGVGCSCDWKNLVVNYEDGERTIKEMLSLLNVVFDGEYNGGPQFYRVVYEVVFFGR